MSTTGFGAILAPLEWLMIIGAFVIVPRFARVMVSGLVGGVIAGILVLGVGLRVAMRIVVLLDPVRQPMLTEETMFILFFSGIIGLSLGVILGIAQRLWSPRPWLVGSVTAAVGIAAFLASQEFRSELFNEGAGAAVNIPLFTVVFFLFGTSAAAAVRWVEQKLPRTPGREVAEHRVPVNV
jgi:hypothetical protein